MKLCRCLSETYNKFTVLCYLIALFQTSYVQSATQSTTLAGSTTPVATTTTEAPTTTTTLPPTTTTISPGEPRTVIGDTAIGQCLCDLTGNECDVNCCCDEDCTATDTEAFICDPTSVTIDNKVCYQEEIFPFSNSPATTKTENGLFCIYYDNYKERNYYLDPDFILDIPSFDAYIDKYSTPSLQAPVTVVEPVFSLNSFYRKGDTVYVVYPNQARGSFVLPAPSVSNECNDQSSIGYLEEINTECARILATLDSNTCTSTPGLSAASYYQNFRVVKTSGLFGYVVNGTFIGVSTTTAVPPTTTPAANTTPTPTPASNTTNNSTTVAATTTPVLTTTPSAPTTTAAPTTVNPALIQTLYNNPYTLDINATTLRHLCLQGDGTISDCTFTDVPTPAFTATSCINVVQEVRYFVTTDGTNGIAQMQVQFVFGNISSTDLPLVQKYSVTYNSLTDSNDTFARSGNPGYLIGKPLLYGTLNISITDNVETKEILIAAEPSLGLTVVRASAAGTCERTMSRIPLRFGEDMRTGCLIRLDLSSVSTSVCQAIQRTIVETLEGPNVPTLNNDGIWVENNRYVGTFGNTDRLKVGDWVKVIANNRPLPSSADATAEDTCRLRMGLHIQVLYANVGALANPQAKIIGVALLYDSLQDVKIRCEGAFCEPSTNTFTQAFEVSQTVSFVDVSQPATKVAGESPVFLPKVPNDFFYPFLYYTNGSLQLSTMNQLLQVIFIALVSLYINLKHLLS